MPASNQTWLAELSSGERVVYKPIAGERPLWDFPHGTLAEREHAAWLVSEALGWNVVPPTVLRDGPNGPGMVQAWREPDPEQVPVDVVPVGRIPKGHLSVLLAEDQAGNDVELTHEDSEPLLRMAVFDVLTNNTDRKGGHILAMADGHRFGVDHGICFHEDDKLRTVLWGFAGRAIPAELLDDVRRVVRDAALLEALEEDLAMPEVEAFVRRGEGLVAVGVMPTMAPGWPAIPWPPF
ncbi:MAG: SCO1664 family protein [Myxococcales bacterium]|nr:MAG: SCO1664 family protein [Myxococcales bacterium]